MPTDVCACAEELSALFAPDFFPASSSVLSLGEPHVWTEQMIVRSEIAASEWACRRRVIFRVRTGLISCNTYSNVHGDMQKWHLNRSSSKFCKTSGQSISPARSLALPCGLLMLRLDTDPKCSSFLPTVGVAACVGALHSCCSPVCYSPLFCCCRRYM